MNRYPLWKNLLVFGVIVVATIIALPNVFGDDEAVQVSRTDGVAMDAAALEQVRTTLMQGGIEYLSAAIEDMSVLVRFETAAQQEAARDLLTKELEDHIAALNLAPRTPGWLKWFGLKPMLLGLDLRGGVHFLYQVDLDTAIAQYLETYESDVRTQLRQNDIRAADTRIAGTTLRVILLEAADMDRAEAIIRQLDAGDQLLQLGQLTSRLIVERTELDGRPGFNIRLTESAIRERQDFAIQQNTVTLRNRVNELGVAEAVVQRQGLDRILVELPGIQDPAEAKRILGSTATLEFHLVDEENDPFEAQRRGRAPLGSELHMHKDGRPILLRRDIIASGDQLVDATPGYENGQPVVNVRLDAAGARKMLDTTVNNLGKPMAVLYIEDRPQMVERDGEMVPGDPIREETVINDATIQGV